MKRRPEVEAFADLMEKTLRKNDHKGGWEDCTTRYLFKRLRDEIGELDRALEKRANSTGDFKIAREAADVANFAMFIADNCGGLESQ